MMLTKSSTIKGAKLVANLAKKAAVMSNSSACAFILFQPKVPVGLKDFAKNSK